MCNRYLCEEWLCKKSYEKFWHIFHDVTVPNEENIYRAANKLRKVCYWTKN
jgi:hypothetical protein